jgi:serine/threonine protein kinase
MGEPAIRRLARELLTALAHLHANSFVHADVKPANMIRRASDGSPGADRPGHGAAHQPPHAAA